MWALETGTPIRRNYAVFVDQGKVVICPLCSKVSNNEIHLVMECSIKKPEISRIRFNKDVSVGMEIARIKDADPEGDKESWLRQLIGQDKSVSRLRKIERSRTVMPGRQVLGHVVRANWSNSTKEDRSASGKLAVLSRGWRRYLREGGI